MMNKDMYTELVHSFHSVAYDLVMRNVCLMGCFCDFVHWVHHRNLSDFADPKP